MLTRLKQWVKQKLKIALRLNYKTVKIDPAVQANIEKQEYYRSINSNINIDSGNQFYTSLDRECDDNALTLTVDGGAWQSEVSWELLGADGTSLYSGGNTPSTTELCLLDGDYTFVANDAFGDGWNGNTANFTDADGSLSFHPLHLLLVQLNHLL